MAKFKVGDLVIGKKAASSLYGITKEGWIGKVVWVSTIGMMRVSNGNQVYTVLCDLFDIYKQKPETIVIYRKGDEVIALDKSSGEKAVAKCSPEDTFDFATGAKIAFDRLMGSEKPKETEYWSGKAVCVESRVIRSGFTVGKVYTFINGKTRDDDGYERPRGYRIKTLKGYEERTGILKFIEYKGDPQLQKREEAE